jgi:hypothetical protein
VKLSGRLPRRALASVRPVTGAGSLAPYCALARPVASALPFDPLWEAPSGRFCHCVLLC